LEIRHLINYKELTTDIRNDIIEGINRYGEHVTKQQDELDKLRKEDDRTEEEKASAQHIKEKVFFSYLYFLHM